MGQVLHGRRNPPPERLGAELLLRPLSIAPLLRHPVSSHPLRHRFEHKDKPSGAAPFTVGEGSLAFGCSPHASTLA
jgi:hypothetical protein